jgi:hypothetical protein
MGLLTRDQIFKADPRTYKDVKCPELGGTVRLQSLLGEEFEEWQETNRDPVKKDKDGAPLLKLRGSIPRLLVRCMVDKTGKRIMSNDDAVALDKLHAAALNRLGSAAMKLNGVGEKEIEEMVKNSGAAPAEEELSS